ncbi:MAG TPA: YidB family protein [Acetobacteraceae bacterium]|nr:YidB family protein [Acetobacteraceae bacterium]
MSGIVGQILGNIMGGQQSGGSAAIAGILQQLLAGNGGGVGSLVSQFQSAGLGNQAQSWVSSGQNLPVSSEQIGSVFSADQIEGWAAQAGTTPDRMRMVLAEALPHAVDHATPQGQIPAPNEAPDLTSLLGKLLGNMTR